MPAGSRPHALTSPALIYGVKIGEIERAARDLTDRVGSVGLSEQAAMEDDAMARAARRAIPGWATLDRRRIRFAK